MMVFRYPRGPAHRLHQARGRPARRRGRLPEPAARRINGQPVPTAAAAATTTTRTACSYAPHVQREAGRRRAPHPRRAAERPAYYGPGPKHFPIARELPATAPRA
ncbi:MAG: hypothetical protein MZW92_58945 [Comamonadaceae bacterium]|nr:hypothetical protein [Comamonadaceae bacterium]